VSILSLTVKTGPQTRRSRHHPEGDHGTPLTLQDENAKLKKLLAEQMLDAAALRELLSKKW
jgi:hypothetical protein